MEKASSIGYFLQSFINTVEREIRSEIKKGEVYRQPPNIAARALSGMYLLHVMHHKNIKTFTMDDFLKEEELSQMYHIWRDGIKKRKEDGMQTNITV